MGYAAWALNKIFYMDVVENNDVMSVKLMYSILHKNPNSNFFPNRHLSILRGTVFGF
jgi:hypothetical protein